MHSRAPIFPFSTPSLFLRMITTGAELANTPGVRRHEYVTFEKHHVFRRDVEGEQPARHTGDFVLPVNVFQKQCVV